MLNKIYLKNYKSYLNQNKILYGKDFNFNIFLTLTSFLENKKTCFLILPNLSLANKYYDYLTSILNEQVLFYPVDTILSFYSQNLMNDFLKERAYTKNMLTKKLPFIVVSTYDAVLEKTLSYADYLNSNINLKINTKINFNELINKINNSGYTKNYQVDKKGEFSVRGSIIDIFPINEINPIRLTFFDNTIEEIKYFNLNTQVSFKKIENITINPFSEIILTERNIEKIKNNFKKFIKETKLSEKELEKINQDYLNFLNFNNLNSLIPYADLIYENPSSIIDYSNDKYLILIDENLFDKQNFFKENDLEYLINEFKGDKLLSLKTIFSKNILNVNPFIKINSVESDISSEYLKKRKITSFTSFFKSFSKFYTTNNEEMTYYLGFKKDTDLSLLTKYLDSLKISYSLNLNDNKKVNLIKENLNLTFIDYDNNIAFFSANFIFDEKENSIENYRTILNESTKIYNPDEIEKGDYVVHYNYGIGKYVGLTSLNTSGIEKDYLEIIYLNDEKLYVPIEQIELVLKYNKSNKEYVKLSKLGSKTWQKSKLKTKQKIKEAYDELVNFYNYRNKTNGYSFYPNYELEKSLSESFTYKLTKGQENAINDVLSDMEKEKPMERLICGDVGFGKTEVAIRATFRAAINSKQTAILCPTTILAKQHYDTFVKRLANFGINIKLLTRNQSQKEINQILLELKNGLVDCVIGTHKILNEKISFKNLGLFIIDEEQKFGVLIKEKIKTKYLNIDTLYLSATPIPRTLKLGLSKIKEMSLVDTAPKNRYPVQTYLYKRNDFIIKDSITKEIARGGQVFYLASKANQLLHIKNNLQKLLPNLKIGIISGELNKNEIENTLTNFINKKIELLLATTIIENGIDIPNANTLLIHDAEMFGLSQLYQIKGRVGRSDKIGYCYLFYNDETKLNEKSKLRLEAIKNINKLGSGYEIAMQDLLIRGAGNILGTEQSGFIEEIGLEAYLKLVNETLFGEKKDFKNISFFTNHIKTSYIESEKIRIEIHKKINKIKNKNDLLNLEAELTDRFGSLDSSLKLYLQEMLYKENMNILKIVKTSPSKNNATITINTLKNNFNAKLFLSVIVKNKYEFKIKQSSNLLEINIDFKNDLRTWIIILNDIIFDYLKNIV